MVVVGEDKAVDGHIGLLLALNQGTLDYRTDCAVWPPSSISVFVSYCICATAWEDVADLSLTLCCDLL